MADYSSATALPGSHNYHQDSFITALPKVTPKGKDKNNSSSPYGREFSTALPQVRRNGYSTSSMSPSAAIPASQLGPTSQEPRDNHFSTALPKVKSTSGATPSPVSPAGAFATALPRVKDTSSHTQSHSDSSHKPNGRLDAVRRNGSPFPSSPQSVRRSASSNAQISHNVKTIYNTFWGQGLTFNPYTHGETPVSFPRLWPERRATLVEGFMEAELDKNPYEIIKLLLATNSYTTLEVLVEEKKVPVDGSLTGVCGDGSGCGHTLAHLACALGLSDVVQLIKKSTGKQQQQHIWNAKDEEGYTPEAVCFKPELHRTVKSVFGKRAPQGQMLKEEQKKLIFELATSPNDFYRLVLRLQMYKFDVNSERNEDGDLLIHVAISGGLPQLPLLFVLVNYFRADINKRNGSGATPLTLAIQNGDEALVEVCICVFGVNVNRTSSSDDSTPLHRAIIAAQPRIVSTLLRRGADPCAEDSERRDPLFLAKKLKAYESRQIITQFLKERSERLYQDTITGRLEVSRLYESDLQAVCSNGCTLLMVAAMHGQESIVKQLLKRDVPIDFKQIKTGDILSSLSDSFEPSWCEGQNCVDHTLKTAVHLAAEKGNLACLQLLLNANAHPSMTDSSGMVPLHYAVDRGHIECVKLILNYPNTALGLTGLKPALDLARENNFSEISQLLGKARERRQLELVNPILFEVAKTGSDEHIMHVFENGDNVNPLDEMDDWPLLVAARCGHPNVVIQLHQFGGHIARVHRRSRTTPLHEAVREGRTKVVKYLLQFCGKPNVTASAEEIDNPLPTGALDDDQLVNINGRNAVGCTPLEIAAGQGHTDIVRLLLEHHASTSLPDSTGRLVSCRAFAGTQFLIESHRKAHLQAVLTAITRGTSLAEFQKCWHGPSDFNLIKENGDSILLVAAAFARYDVLMFLLKEAAAIKPTLVTSHSNTELYRASDQSEGSPVALGHSRCLSDSLTVANNSQQDHITRSLRITPDELGGQGSEEDQPGGRKTALPIVFTSPRHHHRRRRRRHEDSPTQAAPPKPPRTHTHVPDGHPPSSEEEEGVLYHHGNHHDNGASHQDSDTEGEDEVDLYIGLLRYTNRRDGQGMLHRAALHCRHDNIELLLETDKGLANVQDHSGNTPLHLACSSKAGTRQVKQTVQTFLKFDYVLTRLKNCHGNLPEQLCMKSAIRKLVIKTRQARNEPEPNPPMEHEASVLVPVDSTASMPNGFPTNGLDDIPENSTEPYMSDLTSRMEQMKLDRQNKLANEKAQAEQEGGATPPT